jgi:hypothetical protein
MRRLTCERDRTYEAEQCPVTKKWSNTKLVLLKTCTVYETVGSPAYQTPVLCGVSEKMASDYIKEAA